MDPGTSSSRPGRGPLAVAGPTGPIVLVVVVVVLVVVVGAMPPVVGLGAVVTLAELAVLDW